MARVADDTDVVAAPLRLHHRAFDPAVLATAKSDHRVSVVLPARNEAATVGAIVETIRTALVEEIPLVDELVVVDDHSTDDTARLAAAAGATVVSAAEVLGDQARGPGKGQALWKSLHETDGDIVVWCDADIVGFGAHFVTGLLGPLLTRPDIGFVKGSYRRPMQAGDGGGRVTELLARPVLATLFPTVATITQPLSGEYAGRRRHLERVPFVAGYGVDVALLIDMVDRLGIEGVAEVDLGERIHRNRPVSDLGPQATEVLRAALSRTHLPLDDHAVVLRRPDHEPLLVAHHELPPVAGLTSYRRRSA